MSAAIARRCSAMLLQSSTRAVTSMATAESRYTEALWMGVCSVPRRSPRGRWQGFAGASGDDGGHNAAAARGVYARNSAARTLCCSSSSSGGKLKSRGGDTIRVVFVDRDGDEFVIDDAPVGESMLEIAHANDVELEGACEGSLACSTCHVIIEDEDVFDGLPEASDDENDMLDLAFGLTETSRLGCQVIANKDIDGIRLKIPSATRNFAVDGFVPKPH